MEKIGKLHAAISSLCPNKTLTSIDNIVAQQQGKHNALMYSLEMYYFVVETFSWSDSSSATAADFETDVRANSSRFKDGRRISSYDTRNKWWHKSCFEYTMSKMRHLQASEWSTFASKMWYMPFALPLGLSESTADKTSKKVENIRLAVFWMRWRQSRWSRTTNIWTEKIANEIQQRWHNCSRWLITRRQHGWEWCWCWWW